MPLRAAVLIVALAAALPAHAFRCGNKLISEGDHLTRVLEFCGEPDYVEFRGRHPRLIVDAHRHSPYIVGPAYEDVIVEEWVYNFGPRKFMRRLRFENGELKKIEPMGYGHRNRERRATSNGG